MPTRGGANPLQERVSVPSIAQGARGNNLYAVSSMLLHGSMESPQHLDGVLHGARIEQTRTEDGLAESRHFAIFVQGFQATAVESGNLEPDGVGSDIDG